MAENRLTSMAGRIYAIALTTFREAIRKRMLYAILVVVVGIQMFSIVLGEMSLNHEVRVVRDVGLASIRLCGGVAAIILGALLLYTEIQRRTIHSIICKPIERYEFVLGKYVGIAMGLSSLISLFTLGLLGVLYMQDVAFDTALAKAVLLTYMEILLVAGIALFFSAFTSPVLSGVFSAILWFLGGVTPIIRQAVDEAEAAWMRGIARFALRAVPDLHLYSVSGTQYHGQHVSIHDEFVSWGYVGAALGYGMLYLAILLILASVIFSRRDFA